MNDARKEEIIDDLLTARPKGEEGESPTYSDKQWFCHSAYKYKNKVECDHPGWGYTDDTLFALGFTHRSGVENWLCKHLYGCHPYNLSKGKKAALSRRVNRLWNRIEDAVGRVQTEGRPGIYTISKRWAHNDYGTVWARDHDEAMDLGKMFYGYLFEEDDRIVTTFKRIGDPTEIIPVNMKTIENLKSSIEDSKNRIQKLQKTIEEEGKRIQAIQLMQTHLIATGSDRVS